MNISESKGFVFLLSALPEFHAHRARAHDGLRARSPSALKKRGRPFLG